MNNRKKQAILYLDRNGFYFYEIGLLNILSLGFLETSVKNLDIMDEKSLDNQIQIFSVQNKLPQANISIVISPNIIFEKVIETMEPASQKEATDKFLSTVPFANVSSYTYNLDNGVKIIGLNEDLYLAIKNSFEKLGSTVTLVLPYQSLGPDASLLKNFTKENLTQLIKKVDRYKRQNLLHVKLQGIPAESPPEEEAKSEPVKTQSTNFYIQKIKANKRALIMGTLLLGLLVVLFYMLTHMQ